LAIRGSSFRRVSRRFVPRGNPCKLAVPWAALLLAGCGGGGGGGGEPAPQVVRGTGYRFEAPAGWTVVRSGRQVQAAEGGKSLALVAVSRFPLLRKAKDELSPKLVKELDGVATGVAAQQHGSITSSETTEVAGRQARRYDIGYEARGKQLVERVVFVFRGKTEYFILCRFEQAGDTEPCDAMLRSFRLI
jgi:hypothetical protein